MSAGQAYYDTYVEHGEERADAYDVPLPRPEKEIAGRYAEAHEQDVDGDFHLGEVDARRSADSDGKSLAGHGHAAAAYFERDADAEQGASDRLGQCLLPETDGHEPRGKPHVHVDEHAEEEADDQLEQLHPFEAAPQHQNLAEDEHEVHDVGVLSDGQRGHQGVPARTCEDVGQYADDARTQHRTQADGDAYGHDEQRQKQQQMLPAKRNDFFFHDF